MFHALASGLVALAAQIAQAPSDPPQAAVRLRLFDRMQPPSIFGLDEDDGPEPASSRQVYDRVAATYRPRDGTAGSTPWRIRPSLLVPGGRRSEVRDAVLVPPGGRLRFDLRMPEAATSPRLRFQYGMLPEAFGAEGDGALIWVFFEEAGGRRTVIGSVELDPKNDRRQRVWQEARLDLSSVATRAGVLVIAVDDLPGSDPDPLDAVVIATPRIEPRDDAAPGFNILLIGVDTLRADRLSAFGYERPTSPNLERLAARGVRFTQTRSQAPWTLPSFASILTSLPPSAHGAGRGGHDQWTGIDPTTSSLAEILARLGYETQGIVANFLISPAYGLDQGFEGYRSPGGRGWSLESVQIDTPQVVAFIEEHRTTPFLLFWHIMDPHLPYRSPALFRSGFTDPEYAGQFARARSGFGRWSRSEPEVPFHVLDPRPGRRWFAHEGPPPMPDLSAADRQFVSDAYDAEIAEMDAAVGQVLDALERTGLAERTIVAFVADHGEGLGDHGHYHHGYTLYDDQVHIPMIISVPGRTHGTRVDDPVAAIDLAPTLLGALGLPVPDFFMGRDLLAASPTDGADSDPAASIGNPVFLEYATYDSSALKGCILGRFKYLHDPVFHVEQLFDLAADPAERQDVLASHPDVARSARAALDEFRWQQLQKGRYHVRLLGMDGARVRLDIETDDLLDANFWCRPPVAEQAVSLDLDRRHLTIETTMQGSRLELVFWGRGRRLTFDMQLDGIPLPGGLLIAGEQAPRTLPVTLERTAIPVFQTGELRPPRRQQALLWLEAGAAQTLPVVPTPEELELLRQLGYAR